MFNWFRRKPEPIEMPPFPRLSWDRDGWVAEVVVSAFAGFQARLSAYAGLSSDGESDGTIHLQIMVPDDRKPTPPSREQAEAFNFLIHCGQAVRDSLLEAVFAEYETMQSKISNQDETIPRLASTRELQRLVGIGTVYLLNTTAQGSAYAGLLCGCTWDEEHGFGVLTHRDRIVDVSENETAWDESLAASDAANIAI